MYVAQNLAAGVPLEINDKGDFFRILGSAAEDLTVSFLKAGREIGRAEAVGAGYWERIDFDEVIVTSTAGGLVRVVTREGAEVGYDRAVGAVNVTGTITTQVANGAFSNSGPAVSAGGSQLLPANANRRYLLVQNNHGTQNVWVRVDGSGLNIATEGVKLGPGASLEIQGRAPTGSVHAITTVNIAAGAGVVVVEG